MKVEIELEHPQPIRGACVSFQILNHLQQPVAHLWLYDAEQPYARSPGESKLVCELPNVRLNVGHYKLSVHFSEPPGGAHFETLEGICAFEVVQLRAATPWGWRPEACVYREESSWTTSVSTTANS
jgi:lipopolysaccharide transport system ATP-binding protein